MDHNCTVGIVYDPVKGWRCAMFNIDGYGKSSLFSPKFARLMVRDARKRPEAKDPNFKSVFDLYDELLKIADEVEANRKAKKVPDEYLAMAIAGSA